MKTSDFLYLCDVYDKLNATLSKMCDLKLKGYTERMMQEVIPTDVESECIFYLALSAIRGEFEKLVSANEYCGYVVDNNGIIHCINSSPWIAQFDGCKESEIEFY